MKLEIFVLGLTSFFVYNAYADGKYLKMLSSFKKYYKMLFYVLLGIGMYIILKRNPNQGKNILLYANNMIKFMPINKNSMDLLSPIIDFTSKNDSEDDCFMESFNGINKSGNLYNDNKNTNLVNNNNNNKGTTKRSVSETKKKYIASNQDWKCGSCKQQLDHTFEIDHRLRLEYGGSNDVQNLIALCRNCHGKKTASENM